MNFKDFNNWVRVKYNIDIPRLLRKINKMLRMFLMGDVTIGKVISTQTIKVKVPHCLNLKPDTEVTFTVSRVLVKYVRFYLRKRWGVILKVTPTVTITAPPFGKDADWDYETPFKELIVADTTKEKAVQYYLDELNYLMTQ